MEIPGLKISKEGEGLFIITEETPFPNILEVHRQNKYLCKRNNAICGVGFRLRPQSVLGVHMKGEPVQAVDLRYGITIHSGNVVNLKKVIASKPSGVDWDIWLSKSLRDLYINISTLGLKSDMKIKYETLDKLVVKRPNISILTPTYERRSFLPKLVQCIKQQNLGKMSLEWILLDDSPKCLSNEEQNELWGKYDIPVLYVHMETKLHVGNKRNILNELARGEVLINFDDDDLHHPDRSKHSVKKIAQTKIPLVGCSRCLISFESIIYQITGYGPYHSTGGLMGFKREYALANTFGENITHAEESEFTNKFRNPLAQLDGNKVILIICHDKNTFDKTAWMKKNEGGTKLIKTHLKTDNFTNNKILKKIFKM